MENQSIYYKIWNIQILYTPTILTLPALHQFVCYINRSKLVAIFPQKARTTVCLGFFINPSSVTCIFGTYITWELVGSSPGTIEEVWRKKPRQTVVVVFWRKFAAHISSLSLCSRQIDKRRAGSKMRGIFVYYFFIIHQMFCGIQLEYIVPTNGI